MPTVVDAKFEQWKARLLDLSKRNRLLFFKHVKRGNVQIIEPSADEIFDSIVGNERKLAFVQQTTASLQLELESDTTQTTETFNGQGAVLLPSQIRTSLADQQLTTTLYNIRSKARTALEEQGVNVLYLAFGMLRWYEADASSEEIRSPLILVPVGLDRAAMTKPYTLELLDEDILLNPTIVYRMQKDYRLLFPQLPEDWEPNGLEQVLGQIQQLIKGQPRWFVSSEVHLGLFSFEKLVMLRDLESNAKEAKQHLLVTALAGDRSQLIPVPSDIPSEEELDTKVSPEDTFQVLDADSSQQEAIALAKRDVSFVIQGPPGTGKSQTIANIIAERLAQGKKVLFVSEKMAALSVVYKRLEESGLDEFCLEAHSHKANKGAIIAQLGKALNSALSINGDSFEAELRQVADLRTRLNKYVTALHTQRTPLRWTAFQIHGQLAAISHAPDLAFSLENVSQIQSDQLGKIREALDSLVAESQVWDTYDIHPWRGTLVQDLSFQNLTDIQVHFVEFTNCLNQLELAARDVAEVLGLKPPSNLADVEPLAEIAATAIETPFVPLDWLNSGSVAQLRQMATQAQKTYDDYLSGRKKLLALHTEALLAFDDLPELKARFETSYRSVFRILHSNYRRDLRRIQETSINQQKVGYVRALTVLQLALHIHATKQWIDAHRSEHQQSFGDFFLDVDTRWGALFSALDWAERMIGHFRAGDLPEPLLDLVCQRSSRIETIRDQVLALRELIELAQKELAFLGTVFPLDRMKIEGSSFDRATFEQLRDRVKFRLDHLDDLRKWVNFQTAWKECEQQGLASFLNAARAGRINSGQLSSAFHKRFYRLWLDAVYAQNPALKSFSGDQHAKLVEQFRKFDSEQVLSARKRVTAKLAALRPKSSWLEAPSSEVSILRHEIEKKRRHKPIRKLFAEIANLLLTLKPCLMMSPLSVSQFLSAGKFEFDTLIFDEASQICPEDAVSSMMRARQVIIAGDRHQLPPTPFFRSLGIDFDEWNEEEAGAEILDSVLQECAVFMPSPPLKWHYRSRHESLIAFSNHHIYNDLLITFPNSQSVTDELGIEFIHVPQGVYDRGKSRKNRVEAKRVAELVYEHFSGFPDRSLGVVAFSEAQKDAINEELELLARENMGFEVFINQKGPEACFVKNLENVQGDERDVIFFSVGYGKDVVGKITMNFGPLNGEDGIRRLNVAITRARYHIKFVSSILPDDIDPAYPNKGVQLLRHYMEYAQQRGKREALYGEADADSNAETESPFEAAVCSALIERGLTIHKQVGCSDYRIDLAIVDPENPGRYLLGIECDGATYHSAKTARDRDRLRQQVLEGLGWRIHRIWSRDWIANPNVQVQKVLDWVQRAKESPRGINKPLTSRPAPSRTFDVAVANIEVVKPLANQTAFATGPALPQGVQIYTYAPLHRRGNAGQFYREDQNTIGQILTQVVEQEGPIHIDVACRRVASCWGITRVGSRIQSQITSIARVLAVRKCIQIRDQFLWSLKQTEVIVRRPPPGEPPRAIEEISVEEIAQAAYLCLRDAFSLSKEDLVTQTARLLGFERTGEKVRERILMGAGLLISDRRAKVVDEKLELIR